MLRLFLAILVMCLVLPWQAAAGSFEYSFGFSYNRSNYSDNNYSWSRRWGTSLGYHFNDTSELELSFQDVTDRTSISGFEDTTFHDQIYSANWVQGLLGKGYWIQPYVKVGIGQLNRTASGTYMGGAQPPAILDQVTPVLGAGLRLYLSRSFAIRSEATTYLDGGAISTWQQNVAVSIGASIFF